MGKTISNSFQITKRVGVRGMENREEKSNQIFKDREMQTKLAWQDTNFKIKLKKEN